MLAFTHLPYTTGSSIRKYRTITSSHGPLRVHLISSWSRDLTCHIIYQLCVTVFWKTDRMVTNTEIHFMPVDECHTHALPRDTMHLRIVGQVCFYRRLFCDAVKPQGCISWPVWPLRGINKTAWGAKLILTAGLVHHSSCASLGHPLMAQHCHFCLGVCFSPPAAPHPPPPPTPPAHPL